MGSDAGGGPTTASFHARPLHVFADPPDSGSYNAHGQYLTALAARVDVPMRWLGTPGAFSHCVAHVRRASSTYRYLEFLSYAEKYVALGLPMYWPQEVQPYYPWSLAWRSDDVATSTTRLIEVAAGLADELGWLGLERGLPHTPVWMPDDEPAWRDVAS